MVSEREGMSARHWLLLAVAMALAALFGRISGSEQKSTEERADERAAGASETSAGAAKSFRETSRDGHAPAPQARVSATPPTPVPVPELGFDAVAYLAALPAWLDSLGTRAHAGEGAALGELADWVEYCADAENYRLRAVNHEWRPLGAFANPEIHNYFFQLGTICGDWMQRHPWLMAERQQLAQAESERIARIRAHLAPGEPPPPLSRVLRLRAAAQGDLASGMPEPLTRKCRDVRTRPRDCWYQLRLEVLRRAITGGDPRAIAKIPTLLFASYGSYTNPEFLSGELRTIEPLWQLAACGVGLDCGPTGQILRAQCMRGVCGYRHYHDYVAERLLAPAQMRRVDASLPRLIALLRAGDAQGILGPPPG